jgi:hypothetical protein
MAGDRRERRQGQPWAGRWGRGQRCRREPSSSVAGYSEHASRPTGAAPGPRRRPAALLTPVSDAAETGRALARGADLIDVTGLTGQAVAAIRSRQPGARMWTGSPAAVDADSIAAGAADPLAAAVAAAAISTWLGAEVIRTRHVVAVRRAIDMTLSISGDRLPALTTRGLA